MQYNETLKIIQIMSANGWSDFFRIPPYVGVSILWTPFCLSVDYHLQHLKFLMSCKYRPVKFINNYICLFPTVLRISQTCMYNRKISPFSPNSLSIGNAA